MKTMTLRNKSFIVIGFTLLCLILFFYSASSTIMTGGFLQIEQKQVIRDLDRAAILISNDISDLNGEAGDWAFWDDTYEFIGNGDPEYIERNIPDTTFIDLRLNLMLYINSSGGIVFGRAFDIQKKTELPIPGSFRDISPSSILLRHSDENSSIKGIILLPEGPLLIASRPIMDTERKRPIRGSLIWGRYLNDEEIERLSEINQLSLVVHRLDIRSDDNKAIRSMLSDENPFVSIPINEDSIAGYTFLKDIYGTPVIILEVVLPRDIYSQSKLSERYLFASMVIVGIILGGLSLLLLDKLILSRLFRLSSDIKGIEESKMLSDRVKMGGKDELSSLAAAINKMLEALERSEEEQRVAEEELRKHRDQLEEIVQERTSELKKSNENLKISEEKYRSLVESTEDSIYMVDRNCRYLFINNRHIKRLGFEDYRGLKYNEFHSQDESNRFIECVNNVFETGAPEHQEYKYDGRWFSQTLSPVKNETGIVTAVTVVSSDITGRKKAEEVKIENDRLEYANKAKSEFLSSMSHELRTPLNAIIGFSELLKKKGKGTLNDKMDHYVDIIITSGKFLLNLINDILDLSKIEAGKIELVYDKMPLHETLHETLLLIKEKSESHNISIRKDFDPGLLLIDADTQRFKQVVFNLLSNAVKFSKNEGGIITISTKKEGEYAKISVSDTGIGIKKESIGKLFNAFEQSDPGISRVYGGTGLGLAISKKFIELHGGKIFVESKYGEGTTFTFILHISKRE